MPYFDAVVVRTAVVSPHMLRVTFGGEGLRDYEAEGFPDDYCKILFPHPGDDAPVVPIEVDGLQKTPEGKQDAPMRNYTIRRHDPSVPEIDIDFVVHEGGIAASWATHVAAPGARVAFTPSYGNYEPLPDTAWQLLVGDATALPAMGRIVEGLPAGTPVRLIGVVSGPEEEQTFQTEAALEVVWVHEPDVHKIADATVAALRGAGLQPGDADGFVWVAGETAACRAARKYLRHELGWAGRRFHTLGYWRVNGERWVERYYEVAPQLETQIEAVHDLAERDVDAYVDAVEQIYEDAGL